MVDYSIGVELSKGEKCDLCHMKIAENEWRIRMLIGEHDDQEPIYDYYHVKCFIKSYNKFIRNFLSIILPLIFGEEIAKPLILTLKLKP